MQECCGLWPQSTVTASGGSIPYVFREMVTKVMRIFLASPSAHSESVCQKTGTDFIPKSEIKNNSRPKVNNLRPISCGGSRSAIITAKNRLVISLSDPSICRSVLNVGLHPTIINLH